MAAMQQNDVAQMNRHRSMLRDANRLSPMFTTIWMLAVAVWGTGYRHCGDNCPRRIQTLLVRYGA
jgi:hypothetical protein